MNGIFDDLRKDKREQLKDEIVKLCLNRLSRYVMTGLITQNEFNIMYYFCNNKDAADDLISDGKNDDDIDALMGIGMIERP